MEVAHQEEDGFEAGVDVGEIVRDGFGDHLQVLLVLQTQQLLVGVHPEHIEPLLFNPETHLLHCPLLHPKPPALLPSDPFALPLNRKFKPLNLGQSLKNHTQRFEFGFKDEATQEGFSTTLDFQC